jgi:predicted RNase H-like HicB family nuclease
MTTKTKVEIKQLIFQVPIIVKSDTVGFHAYSPALKGLHMDGDTELEALKNARLTAKDFLEIMIQDGIPIPLSILSSKESEPLIGLKKKKGYYLEEITVNI